MACVVYIVTICLLLLTAVETNDVQPNKTVYVDEGDGTLGLSCGENGSESPCESVEVALDSAKLKNSTVVVVKQKCKNVSSPDDHGTPCPTWLLPDSSANGTCRCGSEIDGAVSCNDLTKEVGILDYYCMTYNESTGPVVGSYLFLQSHESNFGRYTLSTCTFQYYGSEHVHVWVFQPGRTTLWEVQAES